MSPALPALAAALAAALVVPAPRPPSRAAVGSPRRTPRGDALRRARVVAPMLAGMAVAIVLGGPTGAVLGVATALGLLAVVGRLEPAGRRRQRELLERQAPLVVDLVAACLASGAPLDRSITVAAAAVGPPTTDVLSRATAALRLGADPSSVWAEVGTHDALAGLARAIARSEQTGAPLASLLPRVAEQARAVQRARAEARIRTAAVRLTAPLGVAFLPAFVLLGVVPVIASWIGVLL